ncbi:peptidase C14 [Microbacterium resistens]|uniref:peptidase C14 n=1 Tax=Microbacterium resistens TaxID=156977 RepID=UPI00366D8168
MTHRTLPDFPTDPAADRAPRTRRTVLAGLGAAALGGVAAVAAPAAAQAATPATTPVLARGVDGAATVGDLAGRKGKQDDVVAVAGYAAAGDGGGGLFRCVTRDAPAVDGGRVVPGKGGAVWVRLHDGTLDFRAFGVFGPETPADDALDAMVGDPSVRRIEAHTDLNFVRRHVLTRSFLEVDFGGHLMTTEGIENATANDPFSAVMFFRGVVTEEVQEATLGEDVPDLADVLPVADSSFFAVGAWYAVEVNALAGRWEREVQRLVQVTGIVDGGHIRIAYKIGWPLGADRTMTWRRIEPVQDVRVSRLRFRGGGSDDVTGSHPLAFEYAIRCDVDGIAGERTFWPLIMRRWNTHYRTENCTLANPVSVTLGGAGYLTQQISCLYGYVANCRTSNARHLNDFTASAYCLVENCHGDGDDQGPFVTHGQYEHDLTYVGNSGLMTFANSGAPWGSAAKRITVRGHVCSWFVARVRVTDLTLEDVHVIGKPSLEGSGMLWINADGAQLRGCSATHTLIVTQASDASARPTVIADSRFSFAAPGDLTNDTVTTPVTLVDTDLSGVGGVRIAGSGPVTVRGGTWSAAEDADPVQVAAGSVRFEGTAFTGARVRATGDAAQSLSFSGVRVDAGAGGFLSRAGDAELRLSVDGSALTGSGAHVDLGSGANQARIIGNRFEGGSLSLDPAAFGSGSTLLHAANTEAGVARTAMPPEGPAVVLSGNVVV